MRPLVMDFNGDAQAVGQSFEYMFGQLFLVAPMVEAGAMQRSVYLPQVTVWYDFWTGKHFEGGKIVLADAPLDQIPLFVKAGAIVPVGPVVQHSGELMNNDLEIRIYEGANGEFTLYEDENDNYNYEKGMCSTIRFTWDDTSK